MSDTGEENTDVEQLLEGEETDEAGSAEEYEEYEDDEEAPLIQRSPNMEGEEEEELLVYQINKQDFTEMIKQNILSIADVDTIKAFLQKRGNVRSLRSNTFSNLIVYGIGSMFLYASIVATAWYIHSAGGAFALLFLGVLLWFIFLDCADRLSEARLQLGAVC